MAVTTDGETATNTSSGGGGGGGGGGDIGEEHKHNYIPDYVMGPGAYIPPESPIYVQSREAEMYHHYQQQQQQQQHHHHHHLQQQQQTPQPYFEQPKPEKALKAEGILDGGEYVPVQQQPSQYPLQIQNTTETVIMEVAMGMQITLPTPDGQSQTVHGPYQIKMALPPNSAPPIQAPPNYQIVVRLDIDQETQQLCRIFSVMPIQAQQLQYMPPHYPEEHYPHYEPQIKEEVKGDQSQQRTTQGGETDEEKNNIKIVLGGIEKPELVTVGTSCVELKWRALAKADQLKEPVSYICEVQCITKKGDTAEIGQWDSRYQGRDLKCRIEKLRPGAEYLSRLKARHQNITGNESEVVPFKTATDAPARPAPPVKELHQQKERLTLRWKAPCDNGEVIRDFTLEMSAVNNLTSSYYRNSANANANEIRKILYTGKNTEYTLGEKKKDQLRPGYTYKFRVKATNALGSGPYSEEVSHQTAQIQLSRPEGLRVVEKTTQQIRIEWSRSHERQQIHYRLQFTEAETEQWRDVYEGPQPHARVSSLRRATKYRFRVQSLGDGAASTFSGVLEESTSAEQPSQPYKPTHRRLIKMEPGEQLDEAHVKKPGPFYKCELSWKAPKETGGLAIQEYQLQQRIADRNSSSWETKYRGSGESTVVDNLPPGSRIEFRVQAISPAGHSAWSMPELVTTRPGKPKPPKKITIDQVDTNQATISWSVGLCVTGGSVQRYEIKVWETELGSCEDIAENSEDPRVQFKNQDKQARQCTLRDLIPGTCYSVCVRTMNTGGIESEWSKAELETLSDKPEAPDGISVTAVQSQLVAIEWAEPKHNGAPITGYEVEICSGTSRSIQYTQSGETCFTYSKLNANTEYTFRVAATNRIGRSGFSQVCKIRTLASSPHIPVLTAKLEYNFPVVRQHALLKWNKPSDQGAEISGYKIECRWAQGDMEFAEAPSETELRVPNLKPDTTYRFRIQATNDRGSSPFTEWTSITTRELPPNPPQLLESEVTHNSVRLTWSQTGQKYLLQMFKTNNKHVSSWKEVYRGEKVTYRASKLAEGGTYKFRILASNDSGDGQFSAPIEIKTTRAAPPPIRHAPHVTINDRCAHVSWAHNVQGVTVSDLLYQVRLFRGGSPVDEFDPTMNKELRLPLELEQDVEYQVQVCACRRDLDTGALKKAEYSPFASFFLKKEEKPVVEPVSIPAFPTLSFNWHDDSVTALLLFLFAILAVLIALCGHHMN